MRRATTRRVRVAVYALKDPSTGLAFYVGKAANPENRYKMHLYMPVNKACGAVIRKLMDKATPPEMWVIEKVSNRAAGERERYWIESLRANGHPLTNVKRGGDRPISRRSAVVTCRLNNVSVGLLESLSGKLGINSRSDLVNMAVKKLADAEGVR